MVMFHCYVNVHQRVILGNIPWDLEFWTSQRFPILSIASCRTRFAPTEASTAPWRLPPTKLHQSPGSSSGAPFDPMVWSSLSLLNPIKISKKMDIVGGHTYLMFRSKVKKGATSIDNLQYPASISQISSNLEVISVRLKPGVLEEHGRTTAHVMHHRPVTHVLNMRIVPPNVKRQYSNSLFSRDWVLGA